MTRMVVDANYLQKDELRDYLSKSADNKVIVTPYVELEMHKGNALINVLKSTEIIAKHPKQVILTKDPHSINRLNGRKKGLKKRLSGGGRTSTFEGGSVTPGKKRDVATNVPAGASAGKLRRLGPSSTICGTIRFWTPIRAGANLQTMT